MKDIVAISCVVLFKHRFLIVIFQHDSSSRFLVCVTVMFHHPADGSFANRAHGSGSARRRRERRLRSWLRHERMTVRMELAAALHHSSFRGAGPMTYDAPRSQMTANSREDSVLFDLFDEDSEGARPDRLAGVRPQERDQRHTVEQIVDTVLIVPSLDVPVPQMDNQLVEVCRQLDVRIPEQVIEVPQISSPSRHCRRRVRFAEQMAEQLVEVPTMISYSSLLQRTVEQNVDIPVPDRGGRNVGLQGFLHRQSSTAQPASQERSSERIVEQIVDSRVLGGGLQDFRPFRLLRVLVNTLVMGFLALFSGGKKVRR